MLYSFTGKLKITQKLTRYNMYGDLEERVHEVGEEPIFPHPQWAFNDGLAYFRNTTMVEPDSWTLGKDKRLVTLASGDKEVRDCATILASGTFDWEGVPTDSDTHLLYTYNVRIYPPAGVSVDDLLTEIENHVKMFITDVSLEDEEGTV